MNLNWNELSSKNTQSFFNITSRTRDVDIFIDKKPTNKDVIIRKIQGKNCRKKEELFKEFSGALQFPYYFGYNWDAFDECMSDLSWLGENEGHVLFITNSEHLNNSNADDFIEVISEVVKFWKNKNIFMKIIFHTEQEMNQKIKSISLPRKVDPFDDVL